VDYAVVTRLIHSETGQVVVEASGITQYGCKAAGELLASDSLLAAALLQLPKDWEQKNLQIVLRSKIVGMTAGPPEILTTYSW
jgi:NAD dependent epimerase/dehydratase family enzyme